MCLTFSLNAYMCCMYMPGFHRAWEAFRILRTRFTNDFEQPHRFRKLNPIVLQDQQILVNC